MACGGQRKDAEQKQKELQVGKNSPAQLAAIEHRGQVWERKQTNINRTFKRVGGSSEGFRGRSAATSRWRRSLGRGPCRVLWSQLWRARVALARRALLP